MASKKGKKEVIRHGMVSWYAPSQLARTGIEVLISTVLGRHADKRILQALADDGDLRKRSLYEVVGPPSGDYWFDYVSDVGDGFDPTYTVAHHLAADKLTLSDKTKTLTPEDTYRGNILIFGGDEVYPLATFKNYKERLTDPYYAAFPRPGEEALKLPENQVRPVAFAIPGNHDWYDSLVAFSKLFFDQRPFAGWNTIQNRSYFAIKLPRGWWLFGTDMQLSSSLDDAQMDYFKKVMTQVGDDDRIILCSAEPYWITEKMYEDDLAYVNRNLGYFVGGILKRKVAIYIAGDRHYYRHHELIRSGKNNIEPNSKKKLHKIVAGGGGAFLHPTHNEGVDKIGKSDIYQLRCSFPDENTSWWLTFWNIPFFLWNWSFGLITGFIYLLTAQGFFGSMGAFQGRFGSGTLREVIVTVLSQPTALFWVALIVLGFYLFTDTHSKTFQRIAGPIHAVVHLLAVFFIGWLTSMLVFGSPGNNETSILRILLAGLIVLVSGGVVGSVIMGVYLLISLNVFGVHHNEAFSSIKEKGYKNFLRLKIDEHGNLTIFPIGIEQIHKKWMAYNSFKTPRIGPEDPEKMKEPFLLESPIEFEKGFEGGWGSAEFNRFNVVPRELIDQRDQNKPGTSG